MKSTIEFRIPEKYAKEFLSDNIGISQMGLVRIVNTMMNSNLYTEIIKINELVSRRDQKHFFLGWTIRRQYTKEEINNAELFLINFINTFEPAGIECGTQYNDKNSCEQCGYGIRQISELILNCQSIPKKTDIARTISNEIIVSSKFSEEINNNDCSGFIFSDVFDCARKKVCSQWKQLEGTSFVEISLKTKTGNDPFDTDIKNTYRCVNGHTIGLNRLSELFVYGNSWDGSDLVLTRQHLGVNRGLLRTYPLYCVSQKVFKLIQRNNFRGLNFEIVKLV